MKEERLEYGLMNDYMFRATLQTSEKVLRGLVGALLRLKEEEIQECVIENPIVLGEDIDDKTSVLDVKILLNNKKRLNIELQVANEGDWTDRSLYYLCRTFADLPKGGKYFELKPTIHIGIMGYSVFPQDKEFYAEYMLMNVKNHRIFNSKFSLRVLDLSQLENVSNEEQETDLYYWAKLFRAKSWEEIQMLAEKNEVFREAESTIRRLSADERIRLRCEAEEQIEHEKASMYAYGLENGRMEGHMKGRNEKLIEQVCKKLRKDKTLEEIAEALEESEEEISRIIEMARKYAPEYDAEEIIREWNS